MSHEDRKPTDWKKAPEAMLWAKVLNEKAEQMSRYEDDDEDRKDDTAHAILGAFIMAFATLLLSNMLALFALLCKWIWM